MSIEITTIEEEVEIEAVLIEEVLTEVVMIEEVEEEVEDHLHVDLITIDLLQEDPTTQMCALTVGAKVIGK